MTKREIYRYFLIGLESEEVREGRRLFDEIMASLEEEKKITIDSVEYNVRIGTISLEELLRP